jgi:hypothetical protein
VFVLHALPFVWLVLAGLGVFSAVTGKMMPQPLPSRALMPVVAPRLPAFLAWGGGGDAVHLRRLRRAAGGVPRILFFTICYTL